MPLPIWSHRCAVAAAVLGFATWLRATEPTGAVGPVHQPKTGEWVFTLMPKAFQRTPDLEMTVNTELTDYGRLLRPPTPQNPAYYLIHSSGFKARGEQMGGEKLPSAEFVDATLKKALAVSGYEPVVSAGQKPTLVIFYFWGSHHAMDREMAARFPELAAREQLERAMLVGGHPEVDRMARMIEWGETIADRTPEYEYLRDQTADGMYYVVASAYDYAALAHKERKLVWRTTMTVNSRGVSMAESLPPLIATAAPFFGRDMKKPEIATRRIARWGVSVGEPAVIESDVRLPNQAPASDSRPALRPENK